MEFNCIVPENIHTFTTEGIFNKTINPSGNSNLSWMFWS